MTTIKVHPSKTVGIMVTLSLILAAFTATTVLAADAYPSRPIRLIVPFPPGGGVDVVARLISPDLSKRLGEQVIVENRPGGGSITGTEMVANAKPDGYTLLVASGVHTTNPVLQKLPFDPIKSFTPVVRIGVGPNALVVNPNLPAKTVKELIALCKQKPGEIIFGSAGLGGTPHMTIELFKLMAGVDFKIIQFKGGGPALIDLMGGHSHAVIGSLAQAIGYIKSGKLRCLGTGGVTRSPMLPDVPTIAEAGDLPGYEAGNWWAIMAPAGTPAPIVQKLTEVFKEVLSVEETKKRLLNSGAEPGFLGPAELGTFITGELARWADVVKRANIKLEQ
ncbi:MAG: tripartite tricarboxylate transporter substrate binding protein [PVC group bacterium]